MLQKQEKKQEHLLRLIKGVNMIEIKINTKKFTVDITGHAEHGEKGEDIVCAAISALFYTLAESLNHSEKMLEAPFDFSEEDGNGHLSCKPKPEFEGNILLIYWTILNGFDLFAKQYKKNIKLLVVG